jgi:hypothetical protein
MLDQFDKLIAWQRSKSEVRYIHTNRRDISEIQAAKTDKEQLNDKINLKYFNEVSCNNTF